nr:glucomannan 4-beta-mannosyltransferase 9-like [Tanacetum cinerariifolium]
MSLHRTKATFIGLFETGKVNEWVVTEKLENASKRTSKPLIKHHFRIGESWNQAPSPPSLMDVVFDGAFRGVEYEEVFVGEGVVVISSLLDMLTNSYVGGIMVSLIFLEGLDEEALVEFMVEWYEEDDDNDRNEKDDLFNQEGKD